MRRVLAPLSDPAVVTLLVIIGTEVGNIVRLRRELREVRAFNEVVRGEFGEGVGA